MMASCDVHDTSGSLVALVLCAALVAYVGHWWGCCDIYDSDSEDEGETDASRSMFS